MRIPALICASVFIFFCAALAQEKPMAGKPDPAELIRAVKSSRTDPAKALEAVKGLVAQGADVNHVDRYGVTPLGYAADTGDLEMTKFLWSKGARHDAGKERPLTIAAGRGRLEIVRFYIENGVPVDTPSSQGKTALEIAQRWQQTAVIEYLTSKGAR